MFRGDQDWAVGQISVLKGKLHRHERKDLQLGGRGVEP